MLTHKIDAITGVYDDLHEKMHEIDKTRKNNLLMYGIKPDFLPEIQSQLDHKIKEIFRHNMQICRYVILILEVFFLYGLDFGGIGIWLGKWV